ncbi:unnamed protein product (macronuclear) [Paramecium tetraurelia]|uniref:Anaphase-promoting complex subunit 4 WD40 domain-containing protein n=1 Tax=Paramecium tetraurelia TaxID=5888 RepID=A0C9Z3_PARTE|nr:uncharacterized protein GSPATT00006917001 [Paramecium tetraurelia]CAK67610.1 unnamed protein product [Paramecium tetraurelia]|eukprot:XP_001435007.1 hypothetical protein (macronuclear) [Paramecium tetraurelia strain d4-2]
MNQQTDLKRFSYKQVENESVRQYEFCYSIDINQENTLLIASAKAKINVYIFKIGNIKLLAKLGGDKSYIKHLKFLNKSQYFLSGSLHGFIIVWSKSLLANPKYIQKIKTHQSQIVALILHPIIENQFISASSGLIQFFQYSNHRQWFSVDRISEIDQILGISINMNGTQIVTSSENHRIQVFEHQQSFLQQKNTSAWLLKQTINIKQQGFRVCFLDNDTFVFQPVTQLWNGTKHMNIYRLNQLNQYKKENEIPVKGASQRCAHIFPSLYNQSKQVLLMKNGNYTNIFKYVDRSFKLRYKQVLTFWTPEVSGTLSDDGKYLITWDKNSRQIQIRIYTELNANEQEQKDE